MNDYKVNLFEIAYLSKEQAKLFKSDFRVVADYFVQMQTTGTYIGSPEELVHVQETLSLMSIMTGDHRFEAVLSDDDGSKGVVIKTMCDVLDRIEEKGRMEEKKEIALNLHSMNMKDTDIANVVKVSLDVVRKWLGITPA